MMTDEEWAEREEAAERISSLKKQMADSLQGVDVVALPYELESDLFVSGPLSVIMEWAHEWRSEIEELG